MITDSAAATGAPATASGVSSRDTLRGWGTANFSEYAVHQYLRKPPEMFARAFARWVATRSGNPELMANPNEKRDFAKQALDLPAKTEGDGERWVHVARGPALPRG